MLSLHLWDRPFESFPWVKRVKEEKPRSGSSRIGTEFQVSYFGERNSSGVGRSRSGVGLKGEILMTRDLRLVGLEVKTSTVTNRSIGTRSLRWRDTESKGVLSGYYGLIIPPILLIPPNRTGYHSRVLYQWYH